MSSDELLSSIRLHGHLPRHIAIIMDGNGRWARERHLPRPMGHRSGMGAVRDAVEGAGELGIEHLSLFAFSQENWQRPPAEIRALMSLLEEYIEREADELAARGVRVRVHGELERLKPGAAAATRAIIERTRDNVRLSLHLFISYSGRAELVRAARLIAADVAAGRLDAGQVDEALFQQRLYTADVPDPDLLIRTSGERRISNFLLWQLAYTELYITPVLWPDFSRDELYRAVVDYQHRDRRFGRVSV